MHKTQRQGIFFVTFIFTLNRRASLSYGFGKLSTNAFAKHIGANVVLSSVDIELCGLPGRTNACVPVGIRKN